MPAVTAVLPAPTLAAANVLASTSFPPVAETSTLLAVRTRLAVRVASDVPLLLASTSHALTTSLAAAASGRRRVHAALGPHVMRVVVVTAATLALIPALVLAAVAGVVVALLAWAVATVVGTPVAALLAWVVLRPVAARDRRRLEAALDGADVVQGVGIRPGYGRSRAVELADGSVVTITRLVDRDEHGRQVGFTRSGGVDGIGRAAAAMALTAHQQAAGERPWFPALVDGRRPRCWGTFGTTP